MSRRPLVRWFADDDRERIVSEALDILGKTGVVLEHDEAREMLSGAGAGVEAGRVRIPAGLVERALGTAPASIVLWNRGLGGAERPAAELGGGELHFTPGSAALRVLDRERCEARPPVTADLVSFARLTDALPHISVQSTCLVPADVPAEAADRYRLAIALALCGKPVVSGVFAAGSFAVMREMLEAAAGGAERLRERPIAVFDCCPVSPLRWGGITAGSLLDCARSGVVAEIVPMPMTGATAPVTLAGAVAQHCAEALAGVVVHQVAVPGAPVVWGGSPTAFDMRHGTTPMGAVETMMIDGANAEIGRRLGLPVHAYIALSDAKLADYQAGFETGMGAAVAALSGIDLAAGPGMLDFESCQSLEKLLLDNEICGMARRLRAGIARREGPPAAEIVAAGVRKGDFLSLPHTAEWFRKETIFPGPSVDRLSWERWKEAGGADAVLRAAGEVDRILGERPPADLDPGLVRFLRERAATDLRAAGMDDPPDWP